MRIFVYGSLRHKQGNSHWMTNAQLLGDFSIDNYQLYSLGHYPGAVPGNGTVHGEVYRTPRWPNLMPCAPGAVNTRAS